MLSMIKIENHPHFLSRLLVLAIMSIVFMLYDSQEQSNEELEDIDTKQRVVSFMRRKKNNTLTYITTASALDGGIAADRTPPPVQQENKADGKSMSGIPPWSKFPRSQFTDHILDNIQRLNLDAHQVCDDPIALTVKAPHDIPNITCGISELPWCATMKRIFKSQTIPYNVSVGFLLGDGFGQETVDEAGCLGNSSPDGVLCMPNMEDLQEMYYLEHSYGTANFRRPYDADATPWEARHSLPVFRGKAWISASPSFELCFYEENLTYPTIMRDFSARFKAVDLSIDNPDLLDARFSGFGSDMEESCLLNNATNGLNKLLPADFIDETKYFQDYKVALALPGIGAPFRVSIHLMTRTAVILVQDPEYEEWYQPYLVPFVHYIPILGDLSDVREALMWVKTHGKEVKQIAESHLSD